jgi:streptogramin lyase
MSHTRTICFALALAALPLIGGCSSSSTSPPPPTSAQALYVGAFTGTPTLAEVFFPFSSSATVSTFAPAGLADVKDVAFDSAGNLYVSTLGNQVFVFAHPVSGASTPVATITLPIGGNPLFITIDSANNLWVSDANNDLVYEFTGPFSGSITPAPAKTLSNDLISPSGIAFDAAGNLYVADSGSNDIEIFAAPITNGETPNAAKLTGATNVRDLAFDQSGNLYAGLFSGTILRYNAPTVGGGAPSITDSSTGIAAAYFMTFDSGGNLYASDGLTTKNVYEFTAVATTFSATSTPAATLSIPSLGSTANGIEVGPK